MTLIMLGLRGFSAVVVLTTLTGGIPRVAQAALAVTLGLWSAVVVVATARIEPTWSVALHELAIGAALGVLAAVPLLAAHTAGRLVDITATGRGQGPYSRLFGILAAAVFVGIDGHVAALTALVESHRDVPAIAAAQPAVIVALGKLVPAAVRLAVPWLVTAVVVQIAAGVGMRLAGRAGVHVPVAAAVPAALVMMTASLVATLAVALAALVRGVA